MSASRPPVRTWTTKRHYILAILFCILAVVHNVWPAKFGLDWPSVALLSIALALCFLPESVELAPLVKSLKLGAAQIDMREGTETLAASVTKSEESNLVIETAVVADAIKADQYKRLVNIDIESHIADLAAKDKQAALLRLSVELEKELFVLHGELGLRNEAKALLSFRDLAAHLKRFGAINLETEQSLLEFRRVRNDIAHAGYVDPSILNSAIDSGIRLLRVLRAVPRERHTVIDPAVLLFSDPRCSTRMTDTVGVLLETMSPDGTTSRQIFPAGRSFFAGETVGWDWDTTRRFDPAFYHDPETGSCREAWSASTAFIGKHHPYG